MGRLFGTDGVRGVANQDLTPELAFELGRAGATVLSKEKERPVIVLGKDTRISGSMLEAAMVAGITSVGADVILLGVVPTPAVAYLTRKLSADAGVMISASHNPVEDNGIKFFAGTGYKLSDETEDEIEALLNSQDLRRPIGGQVGRVSQATDAVQLYKEFLLSTVDIDLTGLHIALDCANGAASEVAPVVFEELGAKVSVINHQPNGININAQCGSTYPEQIQKLVLETGADLGITLDGDADRVLAVDELGNLVDGDHILAICGLYLLDNNKLANNSVAATVYSNGGLKQVLKEHGGSLVLTAAGDRYVLEAMLEKGLVLGGEQSGHVIFLEHNTTGDGVLTALQLLAVLQAKGQKLSELAKVMPVFPQLLVNVPVANKNGWDQNAQIKAAIMAAEEKFGEQGRIFVRASGTESLIRVMGEHPNQDLLADVVEQVAEVIKQEQGV